MLKLEEQHNELYHSLFLGLHKFRDTDTVFELSSINCRITGLDPAGPSYYDGINKELNKKDANFVDIIHSDAGIFGGSTSTGHADFWPNGGKRPQPICGSALLQFLLLIAGGMKYNQLLA